LRHILAGTLQRDENAGGSDSYLIRSLYFDDYWNSDFFAKFAGIEDRKKYRLRYYNDDTSFVRFEKKRKQGKRAYKSQVRVPMHIAQEMIDGNFDGTRAMGNALLREAYIYNSQNRLRPAVICQYRREAFVYPVSNIRITLDSELKTGLSSSDFFSRNISLVPACRAGQVILEVKYDDFIPDFVCSLLSAVDSEWLALSKYEQCRKYIAYNEWEAL